MMSLTVLFEFSSSHRLFRPDLSDDENYRIFGKCSNLHGHGHNYVLHVCVDGPIQSGTGMILDASALKTVVEKAVIQDVDHKDLNSDVHWLAGSITTAENVAHRIFERLAPEIAGIEPGVQLYSVTLQETRRISVTVTRPIS